MTVRARFELLSPKATEQARERNCSEGELYCPVVIFLRLR